jgi:hypothetical protein
LPVAALGDLGKSKIEATGFELESRKVRLVTCFYGRYDSHSLESTSVCRPEAREMEVGSCICYSGLNSSFHPAAILHDDDLRLDEMLPDKWAADHPEAVLTYRLDESRRKAAAKSTRRRHARAKSQTC